MNKFLKLIGFERRRYQSDTFHFKWGEISWHPKRWSLGLRYCNWGGCESRNLFVIESLFFTVYIHLSEEYDRPWDDNGFMYGFYIYDWYDINFGWGTKSFCWEFPYVAKIWNRTEIFDVNGIHWFTERKGEKSWDTRYEIQNKIKKSYPYKYVLKNGEIQEREAKVHVSNMVWTRKWFPFLEVNKRCIDVDFSDEVGERTGSWKGGCISCGYELREGETPEECLRRMERERKF